MSSTVCLLTNTLHHFFQGSGYLQVYLIGAWATLRLKLAVGQARAKGLPTLSLCYEDLLVDQKAALERDCSSWGARFNRSRAGP